MVFDYLTLVHHFLQKAADTFPNKIAVIHNKNRLTYSLINQYSNSLANFLIRQDIKKGDRVGIFIDNSIEYIISYFAILKIGAIAVALNTEYTLDSLIYVLNDCSIKGLLCHKRKLNIIKKVLPHVPSLNFVILDDEISEDSSIPKLIGNLSIKTIVNSESQNPPSINVIDCDIASIVYTSGSTGKPKGVTLSHLNLVTNTKSINAYLKLTQEDKILVVLPFHYCYGKSLLHTHFMVGGTVVLDNRFAYPNVVLETMKQEQVTGFSGVPSTFQILLNHSSFANQSFPHLRYITQAGGAMAPHITKKLMESLPDKKIFIMYGATEASARLSYLEPSELNRKLGSIGKAIPNVELSIIKENGEKAGINKIGEIVARGSNIMQGYWNDPEETSQILKNDGYYTGDLARMDEEGFIYIVGRKKDMIKVGGNRVSAKAIEEIIIQYPDIDEVAIIGIEDTILGEAIKAYIVPKTDTIIVEENIRKFCLQRMPQYMQPKFYQFAASLPKNNSGKILKEILRQTHNQSN